MLYITFIKHLNNTFHYQSCSSIVPQTESNKSLNGSRHKSTSFRCKPCFVTWELDLVHCVYWSTPTWLVKVVLLSIRSPAICWIVVDCYKNIMRVYFIYIVKMTFWLHWWLKFTVIDYLGTNYNWYSVVYSKNITTITSYWETDKRRIMCWMVVTRWIESRKIKFNEWGTFNLIVKLRSLENPVSTNKKASNLPDNWAQWGLYCASIHIIFISALRRFLLVNVN